MNGLISLIIMFIIPYYSCIFIFYITGEYFTTKKTLKICLIPYGAFYFFFKMIMILCINNWRELK